MVLNEMSHFLQLLSEKFIETSKGDSLLEEVASFRQIDDF